MNPIELGKAIADVGVPIITAVMLILVVSLVWYLIKRQTGREDKHDAIQKEERQFYRNLVTNDMKGLHEDNIKNAELNNQGIALIKDMNKNLEEHNGYSKKAWEKAINSLGIIADRLNGGSPEMGKIKKELEFYKTRGIVDRMRNK